MTSYKRMEKEKLGRNYELCEYSPTLQSYFGKRHSILQEKKQKEKTQNKGRQGTKIFYFSCEKKLIFVN